MVHTWVGAGELNACFKWFGCFKETGIVAGLKTGFTVDILGEFMVLIRR